MWQLFSSNYCILTAIQNINLSTCVGFILRGYLRCLAHDLMGVAWAVGN
jgi:hypothetical protein